MDDTQKENILSAAQKKFEEFMDALGLDLNDNSLKDTPHRVAKMFVKETCSGLFTDPPKVTTFENDGNYDGFVLVKNMEVKSLCEHHFQPFVGQCHIAYIPDKKIIGLSKFARIVDYFSRRPQVQERLTSQIFKFLKDTLGTEDVAVVIESEHFCMKLRGVEDPCSSTVTSLMGGKFFEQGNARQEFLALIKK